MCFSKFQEISKKCYCTFKWTSCTKQNCVLKEHKKSKTAALLIVFLSPRTLKDAAEKKAIENQIK